MPKPRVFNAFVLLAALVLSTGAALAEEKRVTLQAAPELIESGLVKYLVPRFSMKTGVRVTVEEAGEPDPSALRLAPDATLLVMARDGTDYLLDVPDGDPHAARFADWLIGEVGQNTIVSFTPQNGPAFEAAANRPEPEPELDMTRDVTRGIELSLAHCGRCHVIGPQNRGSGMGSTPSFGVLRNLKDWQYRFESFYALNPHPSFTQVLDVTPAFAPERPSPIVPVAVTLEDLDEIVAYVARMPPADLGAPIQHQ